MKQVFQDSLSLSAKAAFDQSTAKIKPKTKASVLSIRLNANERSVLVREAAGRSLSAYAREKLFGESEHKRRGQRTRPIKDDQALARVLGALGRSPQTGTLKGVLRASEEGTILLGLEAEEALRKTCGQIENMRCDLITALGLTPE